MTEIKLLTDVYVGPDQYRWILIDEQIADLIKSGKVVTVKHFSSAFDQDAEALIHSVLVEVS